MYAVLLVIHLLVAIALVGVVLLQRSEGGALGIGGGGGSSSFLSGRGTANLLTRATAILAMLFFVTSLALVRIGVGDHEGRSILDEPAILNEPAKPAAETPVAPSAPAEPTAPLAR